MAGKPKHCPRHSRRIQPNGYVAVMKKRGDPFIGGRFRIARKARGLTQAEVGQKLGLGDKEKAQGTISGIECGHRPIGRDTLFEAARVLEVPIDFFTERDVMLSNIMLVLKTLPREQLAGLWLFLKDRLPPEIRPLLLN